MFLHFNRKRDHILEKYRESLSASDIEDVADEIARDMACDEDETAMNDDSITEDSRPEAAVKKRKYNNFLMMSEWMIDAPKDFPDKWILCVCPVGKRCCVVSTQGSTRCYARNGYQFLGNYSFPSSLPGGCKVAKVGKTGKTGNCILDCIYVDRDRTFYVLDLILWNGVSFFGCETTFRHYWLDSHFEELAESSGTGSEERKNQLKFPYRFKVLPRTNSNTECISQAISDFDRQFNPREDTKEPSLVEEKQETDSGYDRDELMIEDRVRDSLASNAGSRPHRSLPKELQRKRRRVEVDGLLFFHRDSLYVSGVTPLVLWLKTGVMLKEVLGVESVSNQETEEKIMTIK